MASHAFWTGGERRAFGRSRAPWAAPVPQAWFTACRFLTALRTRSYGHTVHSSASRSTPLGVGTQWRDRPAATDRRRRPTYVQTLCHARANTNRTAALAPMEVGLHEPTVDPASAAMAERKAIRGHDIAGGKTMKAVIQRRYGGPEILELRDVERPQIGDDEVLVRVHAASIHVGDWILMTGSPFVMRLATGLRKPKNPIPGRTSRAPSRRSARRQGAAARRRGVRVVRRRLRRVRVGEPRTSSR